jgi:hypothetical protein
MTGPPSCQEHGFTMHKLRYSEHIEEIRNPNIEILNKFKFSKLVLRTPHPAGGSPVSNDQNLRIIYLFRFCFEHWII